MGANLEENQEPIDFSFVPWPWLSSIILPTVKVGKDTIELSFKFWFLITKETHLLHPGWDSMKEQPS